MKGLLTRQPRKRLGSGLGGWEAPWLPASRGQVVKSCKISSTMEESSHGSPRTCAEQTISCRVIPAAPCLTSSLAQDLEGVVEPRLRGCSMFIMFDYRKYSISSHFSSCSRGIIEVDGRRLFSFHFARNWINKIIEAFDEQSSHPGESGGILHICVIFA